MLAIIPARGSSKGFPGKNIKLLNGAPLICHSIQSALKAKSISRVVVSTDDIEIARIAQECGADVPFIRPKNLAEDHSMVMDAYLYTVDRLVNECNEQVESFVALLPTAPLRVAEDIDAAVKIFKEKKADSVISVMNADVPVEWHRKIDEQGILQDYLPNTDVIKNRQEFNKSYLPNGAIYVFHTEKLRKTRQYYMSKTYPYIMPRERSADIDEPLDFEWAEFLMQRNIN